MIIVGAKGFAKQLVEVFFQNRQTSNLYLFDNLSAEVPQFIYGIPVLRDFGQVRDVFAGGDSTFCLGIGKPALRRTVADAFSAIGGQLTPVVSPFAHIAHFAGAIPPGATILTGSILENDTELGVGVLLNSHSGIYHDCKIGAFCEIGPGARVLGGCCLDDEVFVGANATILPKVKVGRGAIIGAGAVVTKDVNAHATVVGCPAKPIIRSYESNG